MPTTRSTDPGAGRARRLRPAKRAAIEAAALEVFADQGYTRASVEVIAARADVSTRTLYNHFGSKQELFASVLVTSATRVAERFVEIVRDGVRGRSAQEDLLVLARAIAAHRQEFPQHFQLVRRLSSEIGHLPQSTIEAWQAAGPRTVNDVIVEQLRRMSDSGQLALADPGFAARQLVALTMVRVNTDPIARDAPIGEEDLVAAVALFLHGYAAR